ncbi:interleukin-5 receptor subunit alpha-like [Rhinoderma darwinii]|uniref:interleukin-5 receptor subunit alpha-like n=1 Tax=Rhinoderma darwinii TaxID=43563 RepID=UPI003F676A53
MMACKGKECVWIVLLAFVRVCHQVCVTDCPVNFVLKQPNVTISNYGFDAVNISWKVEEIAEKGHFNVCYYYSHEFTDKEMKTNKRTTLTTNYQTVKLRMRPRLVGLVSNALCEYGDIRFQSKPAEFVYIAPPVYINNVSCVLFNITNLNCSWNFRKDAPNDTNYSIALRLNFKWLACTNYIKRSKKNVGCYMQDVFSNYKDATILNRIRIGFFSDVHNFSKTFRPEAVEILTPPRNILVSSENESTIIKWLPPASITIIDLQDGMTSTSDSEEGDNFVYEIRVTEDKSNQIFRQINDTEKEEQIFPDLAKDKKYCLQIRARHRSKFSKFWGEWTKPVFINKDNKIFPEWILIGIAPALLAALAFYLCKRYIKILLVTPIPHPSQNMKNWLHMDGSNNLRPQAIITAQHEQSVLLSEIEIVTTTDKKH